MQELIGFCDQLGMRITVHDVTDLTHPVWEWHGEDPLFRNVAGLKLRRHPQYGLVVLTCASDGYLAMVSYPGGELLWEAHAKGNLHSVELLPDGRIALAASTGNYLRLYTTPDTYTEQRVEDAHGVLYDPARGTLWVLGLHTLAEYDPDTLQPAGNCLDFGDTDIAGHDLAPCYGDTNRLWVTVRDGIRVYDKTKNTFVSDHPAADLPARHVKGVGNTPESNTLFYLYPNGVYLPWCTDRVQVRAADGDREIAVPGCAYYKLRVFCEQYQ